MNKHIVLTRKPSRIECKCNVCIDADASVAVDLGDETGRMTTVALCDEHSQEVVDKLSTFIAITAREEAERKLIEKYADSTDDELHAMIKEKRDMQRQTLGRLYSSILESEIESITTEIHRRRRAAEESS